MYIRRTTINLTRDERDRLGRLTREGGSSWKLWDQILAGNHLPTMSEIRAQDGIYSVTALSATMYSVTIFEGLSLPKRPFVNGELQFAPASAARDGNLVDFKPRSVGKNETSQFKRKANSRGH